MIWCALPRKAGGGESGMPPLEARVWCERTVWCASPGGGSGVSSPGMLVRESLVCLPQKGGSGVPRRKATGGGESGVIAKDYT